MMKCLVLGGRGFIGSHLVDTLLARGYHVRCFDRPHVVSLGETHLDNPNFELYEGDLVSEGCDRGVGGLRCLFPFGFDYLAKIFEYGSGVRCRK